LKTQVMSLTQEQHDDMRFLTETMRWPYWPFCPVKKGEKVAFVYDGVNGHRTVYVGNLLSMLQKEIDIKTLEKIEYHTSHEMVADGWTVD